MNLASAVGVHLRSRGIGRLLLVLVAGSICLAVGWGREVLLPFSAGILIDLPPLTPYAFVGVALNLCSPRLFTLESPTSHERMTRATVLLLSAIAIGACSVPFVFADQVIALLMARNSLFFFGLGLLLCRVLDSTLAGVVAGFGMLLLAFLGADPEGDARRWAVLLHDGDSLPAAVLATSVLITGMSLDVCRENARDHKQRFGN